MNRALWISLVIAGVTTACSAGNGPPAFSDTGTGSVDATTHPDGGSHVTPDVIAPTDGGNTLTPDSACATQTSDTTRAPMNLLLLIDRSGSMMDNNKWPNAVAGLNHLLDVLTDDTRVGLAYLPATTNPNDVSGYTTPEIPIAALSTTRAAIRASLAATGPQGSTPMACAMVGSVGYFESTFAMDGSRNIILMTDGQPTEECSGTTCGIFDIACQLSAGMVAQNRVVAEAAMGAMHTPPVRTFAIGVPPASDAYLSTIAFNGGTPRSPGCEATDTCAYSTGTTTFESDLNAALDDIRGRAATCEFQIMVDTTTADPGLINVNYLASPGATPQLVPRDVSHTNGWDYSNGMQEVILYGPSCDAVLANMSGGSVQILFGCPTVTPG